MENLNKTFYSRQIKTFGVETMKKLVKLKIVIFGIRGLGIEIAKNLILTGPKQVSICDKNIVQLNDLGNNFFLNEKDVNKKRRDESSLEELKLLNPYVEVNIESNFFENYLNYDIICISEMLETKYLREINENCRKNSKGFIYCCCLGLMGIVFSDFGENFEILDETGEDCETMCIKYISKEKNAILKVDNTYDIKGIPPESYVLLKDVQGMIELNGKIVKLKSSDKIDCFYIGDTSNYSEYEKGGIIQELKIPYKKSFFSFEKSLNEPKCENFEIDLDKINKNNKQMLHSSFYILQKYYDKNKSLTGVNNDKIVEELIKESNEFYNKMKKEKNNPFYNKIRKEFNVIKFKSLFKYLMVQLPSICSFLGGFVAQEIIKFTGLYVPLNQWLWIDFYDSIKYLEGQNIDRNPMNSRHDDQILVFGKDIHEKLKNSKFFLIGSGAVGCEYLKILSLMGAGSGQNSKIIVTDNDNIEISNLNRQFLFKRKDIGKSKSKVASEYIKKKFSEINIEPLQLEVCEKNEIYFNNEFWKKQDFVLVAVDNLQARKYINMQCIVHECKFLECGTFGDKASSQLIIPHLTQDYENFGNFNNNENKIEKISMCTLKQYPYKLEHCIELGRDKFAEYFVEDIKILKMFLKEKDNFFKKFNLNLEENIDKIHTIKNLLIVKISNSFKFCLEMGIYHYIENYIKKIELMLKEKPENFKMENGSMFWTGTRIMPHPLKFDSNDKYCINYIKSFANLLSKSLCISNLESICPNNNKEIEELYKSNHYFQFFKKSLIINELDEINMILKDIEIEQIYKDINPLIFEKDDDNNSQIDFIHASTNLKAKNFNLGEASWLKVKLVAGNIIPSIPTTSSAITGFISFQIYPQLIPDIKLDGLNTINFNFGIPSLTIQRPFEVENFEDENKDGLFIKVIPPKSNIWSKLKIRGSMTIKEFESFLLEKYGVELEGLYTLSEDPIINNNSHCTIEEAYFKVKKIKISKKLEKGKNIIYFSAKGCGNTFDIAKIPIIEYYF
jgi:ubiquitin-activating enzyme E1